MTGPLVIDPPLPFGRSLPRDIERYLADEPVLAGLPKAAYKLRKFVRRNRIAVLAGAVICASLVAGLAMATYCPSRPFP